MRSHAAKSPARDPTATLTPEDHTKDDKPAAAALTAHGRHFFVSGHMEAKIEMKITGNAMPMPQSVRSPTPLPTAAPIKAQPHQLNHSDRPTPI